MGRLLVGPASALWHFVVGQLKTQLCVTVRAYCVDNHVVFHSGEHSTHRYTVHGGMKTEASLSFRFKLSIIWTSLTASADAILYYMHAELRIQLDVIGAGAR